MIYRSGVSDRDRRGRVFILLTSLSILAAAIGSSCTAKADDAWFGRYAYSFSAGTNQAGTGVVVDYQLNLNARGCSFTAEGYKTDEDYICTAVPSGDQLIVEFKSYKNGKTVDDRGNALYRLGESFFRLKRQGHKLLTHWDSYTLPDERPHPIGEYFKRAQQAG